MLAKTEEGKRIQILEVNPNNVMQETLFCIKNIKTKGFSCKAKWFEAEYAKGLRLNILHSEEGEKAGFIEYTPVEHAWRPLLAQNFMFIHCMYVYPNRNKGRGYGSGLIQHAIAAAKNAGMDGICVMSSKGSWLADKDVFLKNGFTSVSKKGRFELLSLKWNDRAAEPQFMDWESEQAKFNGWHLIYADQCPWHEKSVTAMQKVADELGIDLQVNRLETAEDARKAPSGYGVFSLLHNGKLLEDHYLSATRFRTIVNKEIKG